MIFVKKFAAVFTVLVLCLAFSFGSLAADCTFALDAFQPENSNVDIKVDITADSQLYTAEFYVIYESDKMEFVEGSVVAGDATQNISPYIVASETQKGKIKISYTATEPLTKSGSICKMSFRPNSNHYATLGLEVEHAETFDGENILSLEAAANGTSVHITEIPFWAGENIAAAAVVLVMVAGIGIVFVLKLKHKKAK